MNFETDCQGPPRQSDWPPQFPWPLAGDPGTTRRRPARKRYSQVDGSPSGEWFRGAMTMIGFATRQNVQQVPPRFKRSEGGASDRFLFGDGRIGIDRPRSERGHALPCLTYRRTVENLCGGSQVVPSGRPAKSLLRIHRTIAVNSRC